MTMDTQRVKMWKNDPLLCMMRDKLKLANSTVVLLSLTLSMLVEFGVGWWVSSQYTGQGIRFTDIEFYYFALAYTFVIVPLLIGFYAWQPQAITSVFQTLVESEVILMEERDKRDPQKSRYDEFLKDLDTKVNQPFWTFLILALIGVFWAAEWFLSWPSEFSAAGRSAFWYDVKWYLVLRLFNFSLVLYVIGMIILRQVWAIIYLNRVFNRFEIYVHPLHPDEAGGLGKLGDFTAQGSLFAIGIGGAAFLYSVHIWLTGDVPWARLDVIWLWLMYIIIAPMSLVSPMFSAHQAMKRAKESQLLEISRKFETVLLNTGLTDIRDISAVKADSERLQALQKLYEMVKKSFPTWPISASLLQRLSITASLPMLSGALSFVVELIVK